jgi:ribonuclease BN (tRNA processing enzyme)
VPKCYTPGVTAAQILFLGAGDAFSAGGRHQAGYLVAANEAMILLDCGATTLASLKREGIPAGRIDTVFISHLHGDHFAGLPFLFLEYTYVEPRRRPLRIVGPPGMRNRVRELFLAMYSDAGSRPLPFDLDFIELRPGMRTQAGPATLEPFRVPHQQTELSLGLNMALDGPRIVYSGDTGWTDDLITRSEGADLFICECSFFETRLDSHLDYPRIAENRHRFGVGRMILTHLGREVLARRSEIDMELAHDGLRVDL